MIKRKNYAKRTYFFLKEKAEEVHSTREKSKETYFERSKRKYKKSQKKRTPSMESLNNAISGKWKKDKLKKTKDVFKIGK